MNGRVRAFSSKKLALAKAGSESGFPSDLREIDDAGAILLVDKQTFTMSGHISVTAATKPRLARWSSRELEIKFWSHIHATN
jgi:hypothetical protein